MLGSRAGTNTGTNDSPSWGSVICLANSLSVRALRLRHRAILRAPRKKDNAGPDPCIVTTISVQITYIAQQCPADQAWSLEACGWGSTSLLICPGFMAEQNACRTRNMIGQFMGQYASIKSSKNPTAQFGEREPCHIPGCSVQDVTFLIHESANILDSLVRAEMSEKKHSIAATSSQGFAALRPETSGLAGGSKGRIDLLS